MVRNKYFRASTFERTPFQYQKFQLSKIEIQHGIFTICDLDFTRGGNGIEITDFEENHYLLVFDLTSSRGAGKYLTLSPVLTGAGITL